MKRDKWLGWLLVLAIPAGQLLAQPKTLTIEDCIRIALKNNPQLKNAERQLRLAGTNVTTAMSAILPNLSASFSSSRRYQAPQGPYLQEIPVPDPQTGGFKLVQKEIFLESFYRNSFASGLNLNQNIYDGGRWWNRIKQANANYARAEFDYRATREKIIAQVAEKYYELLKNIRLQEVYELAVKSAEEQLRKTESMYEVGSVAQADVYRARVSLGQEKTNLIQQKNAVRISESALKVVLGISSSQPIRIVPGELNLEPLNMPLEEIFALAEKHNPELKSLEQALRADTYAIKVAKGAFLPSVSLRLGYSRYHTVFDNLYDPFDKNYQLSGSISVSWNLFNGFADKAALERESLTYYMDKENLINRRLTLRSEIEQAYLNYQAYEEIEKINEESVKSAEEDLRLSEERYRVGSGTMLDVIDARVNLRRARATLVSTKYNKLIALAQLYSKLGMLEEKIKPLLEK